MKKMFKFLLIDIAKIIISSLYRRYNNNDNLNNDDDLRPIDSCDSCADSLSCDDKTCKFNKKYKGK